MEEDGTKSTEFFPIDQAEDLYLVEYPPSTSSRLSKELANNCNMQFILNQCRDFEIVLFISAPDLQLQRGAHMIESLTRFMRIQSSLVKDRATFKQYVTPVLVRHEVFESEAEIDA